MQQYFDVIVAGAGNAGCSAAAEIARQGFSVALVDRDGLGREHAAGVTMPGWAVARRSGVVVSELTTAVDVHVHDNRVTGVELEDHHGTRRVVSTRVLVDATGPAGCLARWRGSGECTQRISRVAIWGHYLHVRPFADTKVGDTGILRVGDGNSWFWVAPLERELTSIGVVADREYFLGKGNPAAAFEDELVRCPLLTERLMQARLVDRLWVLREFYSCVQTAAGEGWSVIGSAWGHVPATIAAHLPLATESGRLAANAVVAALRQDDVSARQLGSWLPLFESRLAQIVAPTTADAWAAERGVPQS